MAQNEDTVLCWQASPILQRGKGSTYSAASSTRTWDKCSPVKRLTSKNRTEIVHMYFSLHGKVLSQFYYKSKSIQACQNIKLLKNSQLLKVGSALSASMQIIQEIWDMSHTKCFPFFFHANSQRSDTSAIAPQRLGPQSHARPAICFKWTVCVPLTHLVLF